MYFRPFVDRRSFPCARSVGAVSIFFLFFLQEYLVGASPEMFVRCERTRDGIRVETCPISGTIERGANPLEDAQRIRSLLTNKKEESELTMCTDVDR